MSPSTMTKTRCTHILLSLSLLLSTGAAWAGELTVPNEFNAGQRALAADVNANFDEVADQVTDNDARITQAQATAEAAEAGHTVNTQLSDSEVAAAAAGQGFVIGPHTVDTNTQLSASQVASAATSQGFVTGPHTVDTDTQLSEAQVDAFVSNNEFGLAADVSDNAFEIGTQGVAILELDDQLTAFEAQLAALQAQLAAVIALNGLTRFEACSDGFTVADTATGLLWERKTGTFDDLFPASGDCETAAGGCLDPHDVNNRYTWSSMIQGTADGNAYTDFLVKLNASSGFGGHTDWRLPFISELQSILVGEGVTFVAAADPPDPASGTNPTRQATSCSAAPCVDPDFSALAGPAASSLYWSASSSDVQTSPSGDAWLADFGPPPLSFPVLAFSKTNDLFVRAVRVGSCGS